MEATYWTAEYSMVRALEHEQECHVESSEGADRQLDIVVLHTSDSSTLRALKTAATLAGELSARVHLVAPRIVPYPLELEEPQVPVSFIARHLRELASGVGAAVTVDVILCRDLTTMLCVVLKPKSLIVLGEHHSHWWSFDWLDRENRLAQRLRKQGHQVVSADLN